MRADLVSDVDHRPFHKRETRESTGKSNSIRFSLKPINRNIANLVTCWLLTPEKLSYSY